MLKAETPTVSNVVRVGVSNNFNCTPAEFKQLNSMQAAHPGHLFFVNSNVNTPGLPRLNDHPYQAVITLNPTLDITDKAIRKLYAVDRDKVAFVRVKYLPDRMFGFCEPVCPEPLGAEKFYFHLSVFDSSIEPTQPPTPPILGEQVCVTLPEELPDLSPGKAPKALGVRRMNVPTSVTGRVTRFDPERGFGFIAGEDGQSYFLHRVEILHGKLPGRGQQVAFVAGESCGKARACHVEILE